MTESQTYKKKLIEVAIPLEAINKESAREKSIRHGHPSTLHLWWARRPLAACRAVLFASLVDDPSSHPDQFPNEAAQEMERRRLFKIIEDLVKWENSNNEEVLAKARAEIMRSTNNNPPPVLDPFCGGGSIPLEAQRLGLEAHGSDLNPVAVLITKALIEIPPKFAGKPPVNPNYQKSKKKQTTHKGAEGLAADVAFYGEWMRDEAYKRIGKLYPKVKLPKDQGGDEANVIAWIWARTVKCPNPVCGCEMPLVRSFALSTKKGKEAWIEPIIKKGKPPKIEFVVAVGGKGDAPEGVVNRRGAKCFCCGSAVPFEHVRSEGKAGRMGQRLMAMVAEGPKSRVYLTPDDSHLKIASSAKPDWKPDNDLPFNPRDFKTPNYGLKTFGDLFTNRQLVALSTFSDLVVEAREKIIKDAIAAGMKNDGRGLEEGYLGATAYADAVSVYLGFGVSRLANRQSTICFWDTKREGVQQVFARQAIPMTWDFCEGNPFSESTGNFIGNLEYVVKCIKRSNQNIVQGNVIQHDARVKRTDLKRFILASDPPYFDNIGYADLSDFFYIWLRKTVQKSYPSIFKTMTTPKSDELIASPYRHNGSKKDAQKFFEDGFWKTFSWVQGVHDYHFPLTIFYAFKQKEQDIDESTLSENDDALKISENGEYSTGWETMLEGVIKSGFQINGTWPIRTELTGNLKKNVGALASSIVLVCRPREKNAESITIRDFKKALLREVKASLTALLEANIAPVDLPQSSIGPGISVFSKYREVVDVDGTKMSVKHALLEINRVLSEFLHEGDTGFDSETMWAIDWYKMHAFDDGLYGDADNLAKAKLTSIEGLVAGGIVISKAGRVKLSSRKELPENWDPSKDERSSFWEKTQHLVKTLEEKGENATADLLCKLKNEAENAKSLAYRLYSIAESKGWVEEANAYNGLIISWPEITNLKAC